MSDTTDSVSVYSLKSNPGKYNPGSAVALEYAAVEWARLGRQPHKRTPYKPHSQYYPVEASARTGGAPSNFIKGTLRGEDRRKVRLERVLTLRHFKEAAVLQVSWSQVIVNSGVDRGRKGGQTMDPEGNLKRSVARSRAQMKRDMLSLSVDRMITLTYASSMLDEGKAIRDRQEFDRRMRRAFPHWKSVAVKERQTERGKKEGNAGAWHWHIAVRGYYDVRIVRAIWQRTIGEKGRVHIGWEWDKRGNCYTKLASYMAKYMGKDLDQQKAEKHRYHTSGDVDRPIEKYTVPLNAPRSTEAQIALEVAIELFGKGAALNVHQEPSEKMCNGAGYMAISLQQTREGGEGKCST